MIIPIDKSGFLVNNGNKNRIDKKLLAVLDEVLFFCERELANNIFSIYVRGSVAAGNFKRNISDIDFVIVLKRKASFADLEKIKDYSWNMDKKYSWVRGFDLFLVDKEFLLASKDLNKLRIYLKTQSILLAGNDILKKIKKYKPNGMLAEELLLNINEDISFISKALSGKEMLYNGQPRSIRFWCVWMSRVILRYSLYASLGKHHLYTNDLKDCFNIVTKNYPWTKPYLKTALVLSQKPINNKKKLHNFFNEALSEIKKLMILNNLYIKI